MTFTGGDSGSIKSLSFGPVPGEAGSGSVIADAGGFSASFRLHPGRARITDNASARTMNRTDTRFKKDPPPFDAEASYVNRKQGVITVIRGRSIDEEPGNCPNCVNAGGGVRPARPQEQKTLEGFRDV